MALPEMRDFHLVGGTAFALQIGHRLSVDLDFFTPNIDFDSAELWETLQKQGDAEFIRRKDNWLGIKIDGVKIDILKFPYALLAPLLEEDGIRLATPTDIAPMKISAIVGRGTKKDFFDLYFLLRQFSLGEMLDLYARKFGIENHFHVLKALMYFDDAEIEKDPVLLQKVSWKRVKTAVEKEVSSFIRQV